VAEAERLARALAADHDAITECRLKLAGTEQARQQADATLDAAQRALQEVEQARANAAPALDQAKALDARIDTLLPPQQQAQQAHADARQAAGQAEQKRQAKEAELAGAQQQQHATEAWLAQHAALQTLSESWPRWDILLKQATISGNETARIDGILADISKNEISQSALADTSAAAQATAAAALAAAESQRQHAAQQHAAIDLVALQSRKQGAERRRDYLSSAEQCWRALTELQARHQTLAAQAGHSRQAAAQATAVLAQIDSQLPALAAALAQAERSLKGAEAACAENIENLRATLQADMPCPVCGATTHPYTTDNPQLHAMLASLQAQVQDCRLQQQQAQQLQATHHAEAASQSRQLEALAQEQQQLDAAILRQRHEWQAQRASAEPAADAANPLAGALPAEFDSMEPARQVGWFASARASVQAQLHEIWQIEDAWRRAALAKDAAQAAFDRATLQHDASKEAVGAAQATLAETRAQQRAATEQLAQCRHRLDDSLQQLDAAFAMADTGAEEAAPHRSKQAGQSKQARQTGWRAHWQAAPEAFHAECARQAAQWQSQRHAFEQGQQHLAALTLELAGLVEAHAKAGIEQQRAASAHAASDTALATMQALRRTLFNGQPVQQVEAQLAAAITQANAALARHTLASNDSKQAHSRSAEALEQAQTRLATHSSEAQAAAERLAGWISRFNLAHRAAARTRTTAHAKPVASAAQLECNGDGDDEDSGDDNGNIAASATALLDEDRLRALLARSVDWISTERAALHAIDHAAHHAATVLEERSSQRRAHQLQRPPADDYATRPADAENGQHAADTDDAISAVASNDSPGPLSDTNPIAELQQALDNLAAARRSAHAKATELQLALAQDQTRRMHAAGMLAAIATQEANYRLWAQLNDLIGAADGKKFRNVAQQTTLDVLLGYANRHLHELSRRYRLQRIAGTLALMVIDQDMGDELRSVHSLSGGESFLVSLALALGLASLSSNRVRVESLFIDEGFGSLDADTLRVAMDALDGLQAMGRKVGVISHVQEMTERIATKVLVQRTAGGRSLVGIG
jgi:DNA repair protein SbcC/Rad50